MSKHLIIISLHRDEGFLTKGVEQLSEKLQQNGEEVRFRNLYEINFNPVLTSDDFEALRTGKLPKDIEKEQEYILQAEYLWFVFPVWWTSMPAMLKGYIDRIFLNGFAYRLVNDRPVGLLKDKKVIILNSMGMSREEYLRSGMFKAMELTIDRGIFEFAGMEIIAHRYFTSIMSADEYTRKAYLKEIEELANTVVSNRLKCGNCERVQELIQEN
jgi:NAD(P)H dehydrogenase (quinone)